MKTFFSVMQLTICLLFLSGCSSYYYSLLSSNDGKSRLSEDNDFVLENDTVRISYCFYGEDAPVAITVFNKLDEPLFVDWTRSALIIDDVATSYYADTAPIQGNTQSSTDGYSYKWNKRFEISSSDSYGSFTGEITLPKGVSFIPPKSKIGNASLRLNNLSFDKIPDEAYVKGKFAKRDGTVTNIRTKKYTEDDSPLRFRSYLTLYMHTPEGKIGKTMSFEQSFYISQLIKTGNVPPQNFEGGQRQAGDFFYVHNVKGTNAGLIIGAVAIGTVVVALDAAVGPVHY